MNGITQSTRPRILRGVLGIAAAAALALSVPALVAAGPPPPPVAEYTGCLKTNGTANGTVYAIKVGTEPLVPCKANEIVIHLSSGDITAVIAGEGLVGGGTNGAVTLALADSYQLPQSCAGGQLPKWDGSTWLCANDDDTTYSAGAGLDLSAGNAFSIEPDYRLPQTCAAGESAEWTGSAWACGADDTGTDIGGIAATIGTLSVDTAANDACDDGPGGNFVAAATNQFDTGPIALAAGTYRPEPTGSFRWFVNKTSELSDGETFASGAVFAYIVDTDSNQVVSTWARGEATNGDGNGLPYNQDFGAFATAGGNFALRVQADASGCTRSRLLDATVDLYLAGS